MDKEFLVYGVGEKLDRKLGADGAVLEINDNLCHCIIGLTNISEQEIQAVEKGKIEVSLTQADEIIFMCLNINGILMFDPPFNMGLYNEFQLEDPGKNGYTTLIVLVDNDTNIIKAMRVVGFTNEFSRKLYELSKEQWEHKISHYDARLGQVYGKYTTYDLIKNRLVCDTFKGFLDRK